VDDPSGNSFVENPYLPKVGIFLIVFMFRRILTAEYSTISDLVISIWFFLLCLFDLKALGMALPEDESQMTWGEEGVYDEEKDGKLSSIWIDE
jgi:hypothetical protein